MFSQRNVEKNENYRKHDSSEKWDTLNKKYYELY